MPASNQERCISDHPTAGFTLEACPTRIAVFRKLTLTNFHSFRPSGVNLPMLGGKVWLEVLKFTPRFVNLMASSIEIFWLSRYLVTAAGFQNFSIYMLDQRG
ncbi:hypothetical protein DSO57_1000680 [Entomophthora muscae]|uniref:Uncharacterized protein n=1 Tax=Entomophthora muscae TaxID=34485 RepID=A0ACC2TWA1_9FUNG|nr:hypothetical protein DSO57_1000680 [Entomophthora muscae]